MADSTSRWAEALREISGRLEEMPAEESFPAYLPSRLAGFYERAGFVDTLCDKEGSVTVIGAVSPQGGDFSEPVTQNTQRFVRCFWALDRSLAYARHFPSINWTTSYTEYYNDLLPWYRKNFGEDFPELRERIIALLNEESSLMEIVKLIGSDILPDDQKLVIETAKVIREGFLQQNAFHEHDTYMVPANQMAMLRVILHLYDGARTLVGSGIPLRLLSETGIFSVLERMKFGLGEGRSRKSLKNRLTTRWTRCAAPTHRRWANAHRYTGLAEINGSLIALDGVEGVSYDELAEITLRDGSRRHGRVILIDGKRVVLEVFEGTSGIDLKNTGTRFLGKPMTLGLSEELLGRVFDGTGRPIDGLGEIYAEERRDINGPAINPVSREYPKSCILTGISSIDATCSLIRGQKLPIFSGAGLAHNELAAQIVRQAHVIGSGDEAKFVIVFCAMGIKTTPPISSAATLPSPAPWAARSCS